MPNIFTEVVDIYLYIYVNEQYNFCIGEMRKANLLTVYSYCISTLKEKYENSDTTKTLKTRIEAVSWESYAGTQLTNRLNGLIIILNLSCNESLLRVTQR